MHGGVEGGVVSGIFDSCDTPWSSMLERRDNLDNGDFVELLAGADPGFDEGGFG